MYETTHFEICPDDIRNRFLVALAVVAVLTLSESPAHADPSTQVPPPAQTDSALDLPLDLPSSDVSPAKGAPNRESTPDRGSLFQFTVPLEIKAE